MEKRVHPADRAIQQPERVTEEAARRAAVASEALRAARVVGRLAGSELRGVRMVTGEVPAPANISVKTAEISATRVS